MFACKTSGTPHMPSRSNFEACRGVFVIALKMPFGSERSANHQRCECDLYLQVVGDWVGKQDKDLQGATPNSWHAL